MPRRNHIVSEEDRRRLTECYSRGEDFIALAHALHVKRTTAYTIIRRYQATGEVSRGPAAGGRKSKMDQEAIDFIVSLIEANPCITLREMKATLLEIFPQKPEVSLCKPVSYTVNKYTQ